MLTPRMIVMLDALTEREREYVIDHYLRGVSMGELAERDGCSRSNVQQMVSRARKKMGEALVDRGMVHVAA